MTLRVYKDNQNLIISNGKQFIEVSDYALSREIAPNVWKELTNDNHRELVYELKRPAKRGDEIVGKDIDPRTNMVVMDKETHQVFKYSSSDECIEQEYCWKKVGSVLHWDLTVTHKTFIVLHGGDEDA